VNEAGRSSATAAGLRRVAHYFPIGHGSLLIPLAALISSSLRVFRGVSCGHDLDFHLVSWMETQRSWSQGIFYPHWAQSPNWGAGEARFVFYPPVTWILGAILGYAISWAWVPAVLTFLFFVAAGFATRAFARQFLPASSATVAGVIGAATPYGLFTAYERGAFGELASAAWIPLLLLFALRRTSQFPNYSAPEVSLPNADLRLPAFDGAFDGSAAPLALVLALTWLTNAPAGVMASYLLAFAALAAAWIERALWPILRAIAAAVIGLGLAAFYLVPAAWEQRWIAIQQAVDVGMRISDSWLFARHASPDLQLHDQVLRTASYVFIFTAAFAFGTFAVGLIRRKLPAGSRRFWLLLALLVPIIVVLQFPVTAPIWNFLPKLQFLQFPWRWMLVLGTPYAIFIAAAVPLSTRRGKWLSGLGLSVGVLLLTLCASYFFFQSCDSEDEPGAQVAVFKAGTGVEGTDEYAATGSDNYDVPTGLPQGCLVSDPTQPLAESTQSTEDSGDPPAWSPKQGSCNDVYTALVWKDEYKLLKIDSRHDGFVILRLRRYPAWAVTVNGKLFNPPDPARIPPREDGLIVVPVPAGPSAIEVHWTTTLDTLWGRRISLVSLVLLAALWIAERKARPSPLKAIS
jgi:hypothetical protein